MAFVYSWTSDALGLRWPVIAFGGTVAFVGSVILACWPASLNAKFAGFFLSFTVTSTNVSVYRPFSHFENATDSNFCVATWLAGPHAHLGQRAVL